MTPADTMVMARPMLKQRTSPTPKVNRLSCKQSSRTVIAAGQGIRPRSKRGGEEYCHLALYRLHYAK